MIKTEILERTETVSDRHSVKFNELIWLYFEKYKGNENVTPHYV